jgi:hypothetical protein
VADLGASVQHLQRQLAAATDSLNARDKESQAAARQLDRFVEFGGIAFSRFSFLYIITLCFSVFLPIEVVWRRRTV